MLWRVTKLRRLKNCGRATRSDTVEVHRIEEPEGPRATMRGLVSCGSVWSCPVCAAHVRYVRSLEVAEACVRHLDAGGGLLFLTLTLRHHRGEQLAHLLDGLLQAQRLTFAAAPWKRAVDRYGITGRIRATEVTWTTANGWHPHSHVLLFLERPITPDQCRQLETWLADRWISMVERQGLQLPDHMHGCRLELVTSGEGVGAYVAKVQETLSGRPEGARKPQRSEDRHGPERHVALEVTRADLKRSTGGLMPFDLLEAAGDGEAHALALWWEYEASTRRRRCIEWSRGLRERLAIGPEVADHEIVAEDTTTEDSLLVVLPAAQWHAVTSAGLDVELLEAAEDDGLHGVLAVVARAVSS